ncbi:hypothetical protein [Acaryochloris sp. CCMEE 5410]|uniref:hypothetical protein n=1 Tax=Acaryochloris sp. CCMEE 5410 TaxID=310037 RepID=UPI00024846B6|nr:hypothetical protein [Acaryochloris sp. CCMEE 5410]KAI9131309.1 hypothetical protein ON05_027095 [Acaryochloris sp. CCMEE 5410]
MGQVSVYYVPENQDQWSGCGEELAERLWEYGVFLKTPVILNRIRAFRDADRPFPDCDLDIKAKFGGMGIVDESKEHPVPNYLYEIKCPKCSSDVMDNVNEVCKEDSKTALQDRAITCPFCTSKLCIKDLNYVESMEFARFYVYVSDCDQEVWDPKFRQLLEGIVGPCHEYWEWST